MKIQIYVDTTNLREIKKQQKYKWVIPYPKKSDSKPLISYENIREKLERN
jgi:hypothetical protein